MTSIQEGSTTPRRPPPVWLRWLLRLGATFAFAYLVVLGFLYFRQESLLFRPQVLPVEHRFRVPGVREVEVAVDGATLSALHFAQPNAKGVVFFLHGNAGNLDNWLTSTELYQRTGFDLFMIDYRGFGKSSGRIESESQLFADVRAAWQSIAPRYAGKRVVFYGRSLGTGLATQLATQHRPDLLVLVSPYRAVDALAKEIYPFVPKSIVRYPLRTEDRITQVSAPVMILHGDRDRLIPIHHAEALKAVRIDAELIVVAGAGHNDIHSFPAYVEALAARLEKL